jgi:cytochrome c553
MIRVVRAAAAAAAAASLALAFPGRPLPACAATAPKTPDYARDVAPLLRERCVACHGPDEQESYLRLDSRAEILKGGMTGPVVVPGRSADSLLVRHLTGAASPRMPHKKAPLPEEQIARLAAWIDAGLPGSDATPAVGEQTPVAAHWAYVKPVRPAVPTVRHAGWVRGPIDAFVLARLEAEGLVPAPEASRETLLRRLSLDLVGLPPTVPEIDAFLADRRPDAYERVVDRLLASPRYGERWARPWLDLARYADTNGYEKDQSRTAWSYRDWVIDALNRDLSFRDFTIEQLAGDMLPGATVEQRIATGFHRNTQLNQEGGIDVEEARFETLVDRVNTTATVWLGTTLACAQCHNHKFDPVSQRDYYRMLAFFDNGEYSVHGQGEEIVDRWVVEPELELPTAEQAKRLEPLRREAEALRLEIGGRDLGFELEAFEGEIAAPIAEFDRLEPVAFAAESGASFRKLPDGSLLVSGEPKEEDAYTVRVRARTRGITAFRLEALPDPSLPQGGPGLASSGSFVVTGLAVSEKDRGIPLARAVAAVNERRRPASAVLDHHDATGWGVTGGGSAGRAYTLIVPVAASPRAKRDLTFTLAFRSGASLGRFRLSATSSKSPLGRLAVPAEVRQILDTPASARAPGQVAALLAWFRPLAPSLDAARDRLRTIEEELDQMRVLTTPVLRERAGFERPSTLLRQRGSFTSPGERVFAAVPAALGRLPEDQPANRLGLARWLVSPENPLTARVTVNRLWETVFGRGLVGTVEDFGTQGEKPSHPELLDWLAVELVEKGWSQKTLLREIVTSSTYRQSSTFLPALRERDPENRLLSRGARFRVEAEMVRDVALAASGLLSPRIGGPSVFPLQPEGIWNVPYSSLKWQTSTGEDRHRRSLYTFVRRSSPYPSLSVFDAPSREHCVVRRPRTNTPLQALTTLNDPVFVEAARALASRMAAEGGRGASDRIVQGHRLCTAQRPGLEDLSALVDFYERERDRFRREPESLRALLAGDAATPEAAERAALTMVASVLLNLDATLTRE